MTVVTQIFSGSVLLGLCSLVHLTILLWAIEFIRRIRGNFQDAHHRLRWFLYVGGAFAAVILAHTIQVWLWAGSFVLVGALPDIGEAIYFAIVTYTTLGYGDVVVGEGHRVFASMAAVTGLLTFGLSTAFLVGLVTRLLAQRGD